MPLRWGLPAPRFAPALAHVAASWGGACRCDGAHDYANCAAGTEGALAAARPCDLEPGSATTTPAHDAAAEEERKKQKAMM